MVFPLLGPEPLRTHMAAPNTPALRVRAWVQGGWSGGGEGLSLLLISRPFSAALWTRGSL